MVLPGARRPDLPPIDEYVVEPESRQEMIDGHIVHAAPASPPHAELHTGLDYVLRAHVAPGYVCATNLLTRTSERWSFAADASIRKAGTDPTTDRRYLEELAFEIKHKQSMKDLTARARQLAGRGVRRVFAICASSRKRRGEDVLVAAGPVMEWVPGEDRWRAGRWVELDTDALIADPVLRCPIRVQALLDAAEADRAVARALLTQGNPVLVKAIEEAKKQARAQRSEEEALRHYVLGMCDILAIEITPARRARIETLDADGLVALRDHLKAHRRWDD